MATVLIAIVMIAPTVSASTYEVIDRNHSVRFYSATGGTASGSSTLTDGIADVSRNRVEALSNCVGSNPLGASGWAYVYYVVECQASGNYRFELWGNYWGIGSAVGSSVGYTEFNLRVEDAMSRAEVAVETIRHLEAALFWAFNEHNNFHATVDFYGQSGHFYAVGLYVKAWSGGVIGSAIIDAAGDQGAYYTEGLVRPI